MDIKFHTSVDCWLIVALLFENNLEIDPAPLVSLAFIANEFIFEFEGDLVRPVGCSSDA